jgi:hypothetical protein
MALRAQARRIKLIGATLTPFGNETFLPGAWNPVRKNVAGKLQSLLVGPRSERAQRVVEDVREIEVNHVEVELVGLDLGEVEDIVDQPQQRVRGDLHRVEILPLLTIRTARSRISCGYLVGLVIAPILSRNGASRKPGAVHCHTFQKFTLKARRGPMTLRL